MPAQYATEEEFKDYPTGIDVSQLAGGTLGRMLIRASSWFDGKAGHGPGAFAGGVSATYTFDGNGKPRMMIPFAISISAVTIDAAVIPTTQWIAGPEESWIPFYELALYVAPGTTSTSLLGANNQIFSLGVRNVGITAVWGYQTITDDQVKEAVILRAADMIKSRAVRTFANSQSGSGGQSDATHGHSGTKMALTILRDYTRNVPL